MIAIGHHAMHQHPHHHTIPSPIIVIVVMITSTTGQEVASHVCPFSSSFSFFLPNFSFNYFFFLFYYYYYFLVSAIK
jgi:hypothetical protein